MNDAILAALAEGPDWHTAGAVSWVLGEGAFGTLGTELPGRVRCTLVAGQLAYDAGAALG